jgi:ubiquinone/menaquinone biosynthesis C-methylase UbiE
MHLQGPELKSAISHQWDESSQSYDSYHGHGIKSEEEREAWKSALAKVLCSDRLRILDVGCGTGEMSLLLAEMGHVVKGIDLSEKMLLVAGNKAKSAKLKANFEVGDAENLAFEDESFDVVFNRHLLWTLPHCDFALTEWKRVLRDQGRVIVIDGLWNDGSKESDLRRLLRDIMILMQERRNPRRGYYPKEVDSALPHSQGLSAQQARSYLENAGFQDINIAYLKGIQKIQARYMPFSQKITYNMKYYIICAKK